MNPFQLMKKIFLFFVLFISFNSIAQISDFEGHWVFDKMTEEKELDEIGKMMVDSVFF